MLAKAPTPAEAKRLRPAQIGVLLVKAGRKRNLEPRAGELHQALQRDQLVTSEPVATAFAATTRAADRIITELNRQVVGFETELVDRFEKTAESGDDPNRVDDVKPRRNYAGT